MTRRRAAAPALYTVVETVVDGLRPHPKNPRRILDARFEALVASLRTAPEMMKARPLVALVDGTVIMGNMRLRAVQRLGWVVVPCMYVELDEATAVEWMLRDNNGYGEWDDSGLEELLASLFAQGRDLALTGFDEEQVQKILAASGAGTVEIDPVMAEHADGIQRMCWWPGNCVPISEADSEALDALRAAYLEANGVDYGFIASLLEVLRGSGRTLHPGPPDQ